MAGRSAHREGSFAFLLALLCGCSSCEQPPVEPEATETPTAENETGEAGERHLGTVTGRVTLAEGFALPAYTREALAGKNASAPWPASCPPENEDDLYPLKLGAERGLEGMMVVVTADDVETFTEALGEWEPVEHVVTITDCRLEPRLVTASRGDRIVVRNETDHPFLPRLGPSSFMRSAQRGESLDFNLERGGVVALDCSFGSPCGRTDVVTLYRPVHTVTGEGGAFTIPNVPAGMPVTVRAWHPIYGTVDVSVDSQVSEGGTETVDLTLTPPAALPEGAEAAGEGVPAEAPAERAAPEATEATEATDLQ